MNELSRWISTEQLSSVGTFRIQGRVSHMRASVRWTHPKPLVRLFMQARTQLIWRSRSKIPNLEVEIVISPICMNIADLTGTEFTIGHMVNSVLGVP